MTDYWSHIDDISINSDFTYGAMRSATEFFDSNGEFSFVVIEFEPGEGGPLHYHDPPVEEIYMVLEGKLDVRVADTVCEADEGTVLYAPPNTLQQPMNNYDEPAVLLAVYGPGTESQSVRLEDEWSPP